MLFLFICLYYLSCFSPTRLIVLWAYIFCSLHISNQIEKDISNLKEIKIPLQDFFY